ncbi:radial spoke head 10 homolog B-like isoform X2 [Gigantopelta aegis]|uniref:radial spoke head 10 homolog B-like isoform X2 n=1 Tax=Gigantopelta aegis TaxID=1735272 RepID=UPI001B88ACD2|nr:radial spoke head 10 homolog B-like isoform X2 [Gigantopelta aegis]
MATKDSKAKKVKESDKKAIKKLEEALLLEEGKDDSSQDGSSRNATTGDVDENNQTSPDERMVVKDPTPEPVYDEPTLAEIIIECFEGEKVRGLFQGEGEAVFSGGNVYKGQFLEGLMHGKGVYIWKDGVVYEGDFYKNQITGKGIYKWPDGSSYEGDVFEGKRHGCGIFRCPGNVMSYNGEWCQGKRHGKGRMDYDSEGRSYYDGDWVSNIRHGLGTRQYPSSNIYQGMWFSNVRHGDGTMKWLDRNQIYTGQWENGIQHGMGQHIWLLQRVKDSQYAMRNMYDGEFVNGLRNGFGTFLYANGARYSGFWRNNMKHGKGKFVFKNGRIYEGMFEKDHISEYPQFNTDGNTTPDISQIRTRTPLPSDNISIHSNESCNTISPSFQLEVDHLLCEFPNLDREDEIAQVMYVVFRNVTSLRKIYACYSGLGYEESPDNTFTMNRMQFWRFVKDCQLHHGALTLMDMDRILGGNKQNYELHNPYEKILQREFINYLIILSFHLYHEEHDGQSPLLAWCMSKLISENVLLNACNIKGNFYYETRRAVNALVHMDQAYEVYQTHCTNRKYPPKEPAMKMRQFLFLMKDLNLINEDLTAQAVIAVLCADDPAVSDGEGCYNLELEMTFLEFFEALVACAEVYVTESVVKDPGTPRSSTALTQEQSMYSCPASPSRLASQVGMDDGADSAAHITPHVSQRGSGSPDLSPLRAQSSGAATHKTSGDESTKHIDGHDKSAIVITNPDLEVVSDSRHESARDDVTPLADHPKSSSFFSQHTVVTDDNQQLHHSSVSVTAQTEQGAEDGEGEGDDDQEEYAEEELDEATRLFNFWTHQIHIFFVRKFFPAADRLATLIKLVTHKNMLQSRRRFGEPTTKCSSRASIDGNLQSPSEKVQP